MRMKSGILDIQHLKLLHEGAMVIGRDPRKVCAGQSPSRQEVGLSGLFLCTFLRLGEEGRGNVELKQRAGEGDDGGRHVH